MTVDSTSFTPCFSVDFWQPYVPVSSIDPATGHTDATRAPGLSYSASLHGSHDNFCGGEYFVRYKEEVRANLSFLVEFCQQHHMHDAGTIENDFDTFFRNRFEEYHYFSTRAEMVDSIGKRSLDDFCAMIRNEAIDEGKRTAAIRDLSRGVILCADGAVSNLVSAACMLAKSAGGIRGKLWELKEAAAVNVLRQLMDRQFGDVDNYRGNEIHYVNTAWNRLANQFGLQQIPDGITMPEVADDTDLLTMCAVRISAALTPDQLSLLIAEACQARFNSEMAPDESSTSGLWNARAERKFSEALEDIGNEFGLMSADALDFDDDAATATLRASELRMKSFVELKENAPESRSDDEARETRETREADANDDTCIYIYTVRADPSLVALDVLRAMDRLKLLQAQTGPQNGGEWTDQNGMRAALFVYGELAWVVRIPADGDFEEPVWNSRNAEFELITLPDLLRWKGIHTDDGPLPPAPALRQAIRVSADEQLVQMPARWLAEADNLQRLLRRLGPDKAADYLTNKLALLGPMGTDFTNQERKDLLAAILRMGIGKAVRALAERWFPHESTRMDMVYAVLLREAVPTFHQAMLEVDAKAAVGAWYRPLRESGLLTMIAPRLADLLDTWHAQSSIFSYVLRTGHAAAVEAFHALLKDLLQDATVRWHMKDELRELLTAMDCYDVPALVKAMMEGHSAAVQAHYTGLKDLLTDPNLAITIRPVLLQDLPSLLVGKKRNGDSGLGFAVEGGKAAIITTFHAMLNDLLGVPNVAPRVQGALPDMLAARLAWGASALSQAMWHEGNTAIDAFYAMLADPGILPYLRHAIPDLLSGMDSCGRTGLSNSLGRGHTASIEAYHRLLNRLLNTPTIAPYIRRAMPSLVNVKNRDNTSGCLDAIRNGHTAAVQAYFAMLDDPAIAPYISEDTFLSMETLKRELEIAASGQPDLR